MKLRLILGDQLNYDHSWFSKIDSDVMYLMMEVKEETSQVINHIQKVVGFFLARRNFSNFLEKKGHMIIYFKIDDYNNKQTFVSNLLSIIEEHNVDEFEYLEPDDYSLNLELKKFSNKVPISTKMVSTEHFLTTRSELRHFFKGKKAYLMESFYRYMRKKYKILVDNNQKPIGGRWNFDSENRKSLPNDLIIPNPLLLEHNVEDILKVINKVNIQTFGNIDPSAFIWPINRQESLQLLEDFIHNRLSNFGLFQDAMSNRDWSLFHSRLSFSLNIKMLHPLDVIKKAIIAFQNNRNNIKLPQIEGFIRQILGWREYMRGIYWANMPSFGKKNFFSHYKRLPLYYWTGKTKMNCIKKVVTQSLDFAYAHHIQRLMITGNFALLAGIDPDEVDKWYMGIYIDAIQWVEITNTRGMSQYADGGLIATKPYIASANYINKMSDYCNYCFYNRKEKTGDKACPFNSLYWRFIHVNRSLLQNNARINMVYSIWNKMDPDFKKEILKTAEKNLVKIENL